jgi:hypothetical protein
MRKKWLVFTLVLTFAAVAASAQAASVPTRMNGSSWNYTAFQMAKYTAAVPTAAPSVAYGKMLNSTYNGTEANGPLLGRLDTYSAAAGPVGTFTIDGGTNATYWRADQQFGKVKAGDGTTGTNATDGLLALEFTNGTSALYFINNPAQTLFASVSPENYITAATNPSAGPHLGMMVQNLTISNNVTDVAGTWYFYSLESTNGTFLASNIGAMVLTSTGSAGSMSYATVTNNGTANSTDTDTVTWGLVDSSTAININATDAGVIVNKAYISQDKKMLIGYNAPSAAGNVRALVALKSGSTVSSSDFTSAGYKSFGIYMSNASGYALGNGTLQTYYTDANRKVIAGNQTSFGYNGSMAKDSLVDKTVTVGATTLGGVTQSTVTLTGGANFVGRKISDVMAGLLYDATNGVVGLQIMVPAGVQVSAPAAPSSGEVTTLNTFTFSGGGTTKVITGTDVATGQITTQSGANLGTLASQFENSTSEDLKTTYSLGSGTTIDRNYPTLNFAVNLGAGNGGNYTVRKISFGGNNKLISELPVPTKFYVAAVTTAAGTTHAANTYKTFTYRNAGADVTDGSYWITPSGFPALVLSYTDANRLALGSNYDMWLAIKDNGDYDLDPTGAQIADPGAFVAGLGGGGGGLLGGSSSSGCVLNPAAGFSVEMLLLLLTPLAYFIRRRKK